jgi:hypothetical protein
MKCRLSPNPAAEPGCSPEPSGLAACAVGTPLTTEYTRSGPQVLVGQEPRPAHGDASARVRIRSMSGPIRAALWR